MAALSSAIIGAAVIGGTAAVYTGSQSAKAAKKAGQAQQQSADQALQLQREQYAKAFEVMEKYGVQGDWARDQMSAFLGGPATTPKKTTPAPGTQPAGTPNAQTATYPGGQGGVQYDPMTGIWSSGDQTNPAIGHNGGPPMEEELKTADQRREEAWDNYEKSPFASIARRNADRASEDFTAMAGAQGSALSGRTARGMAEVRDEMEQDGFGSYYSALSGVADMGFNADSAKIGAGQNYANNGSAILTNKGNAQADSIIGQADAWNSALSDAAGWAGWGLGQMPGSTQTTFKTPATRTGTTRTQGGAMRRARVG
jgi:hypothetical protein